MENIINKKGFEVGDKVKAKRETTAGDYRWLYPSSYKGTKMIKYMYSVGKLYKVKGILPQGVRLDNCAVIPNHLIVKV